MVKYGSPEEGDVAKRKLGVQRNGFGYRKRKDSDTLHGGKAKKKKNDGTCARAMRLEWVTKRSWAGMPLVGAITYVGRFRDRFHGR